MKHLIAGTAGHIDHGKTSLVKALTGTDTDRLKEEKLRGITIELGFAHLELPGFDIGIIDVPGHERFVHTMVAGVGGMDLVMLVIAADEGVMPQTREHLEICQLLGVKRGVVVLTKSDLVEPDWLDLVTEEVREYLAESFLQDAPIVQVSSRSGTGIEALKGELSRLALQVEEKRSEGPFRLPVDRVFTVTGFGTVVTGTLLSGGVAVGEEVEILPSGRTCRVRGLQAHGKKPEKGVAGQRLAINLQGVEHTEVARGDVVAAKGAYRTTRVVDVHLDYLPSAPKGLKNRAVLRLHSATYEVAAKVLLIDRDVLAPGEQALVQLRLESPVLLMPGDPFVLRNYSPQATVGGGRVLDPAPPRRRRRSVEALDLLAALEGEDEGMRVKALVAGSLLSGTPMEELLYRSGLSSKRLDAALSGLLASGEVVQVLREPRVFLAREAFATLKDRVASSLLTFLKDNPLKVGIGKEELRGYIPRRSDPRFFGAVLAALEKEGRALSERELITVPGRVTGVPSSGTDLLAAVEGALAGGGMEPPTLKEIADSVGCAEKKVLEHLGFLAREGRVVKIKSDLFYAPEPLAEIRSRLVAHLKEAGEITPGQFRDATGLSRKFMIPLLEFFDSEKVTIRVGDKRVLRKG